MLFQHLAWIVTSCVKGRLLPNGRRVRPTVKAAGSPAIATAVWGVVAFALAGSAVAQPNLTAFKPSGWSGPLIVKTTSEAVTDSATFFDDETVFIAFSSTNPTATTASTFVSRLVVDGTEVQSWRWSQLEPGYYTTPIGYNIGRLTAGTHTIAIELDYLKEVTETDETDNVISKSILVRPRSPAPAVSGLANRVVMRGQSATLSVVVTGAPPLSLQWYAGSSGDASQPIAGATGATFVTPALNAPASYWVRVSNAGGRADSSTVTVNVLTAPAKADVNQDGRVDARDLLFLAQRVSGIRSRTDSQVNADAADVNADGQVNEADVTILADYLSERRTSIQPEKAAFRITGFSAAAVQPLSFVRIRYSGAAADEIVDVKFAGRSGVILNSNPGEVTVCIPMTTAGLAEVRLMTVDASSGPAQLRVDPLPAPTMTPAQLGGVAHNGPEKIGRSFVDAYSASGALTAAQAASLNDMFVTAGRVLADAQDRIGQLDRDQLQILEQSLRGTGLLELFQRTAVASTATSAAPRPTAAAVGEFALHQVLYSCDVASFTLSYINKALLAGTIVSMLVPGGQPVAAILKAIGFYTDIVKAVLDLAPTNLQSVRADLGATQLNTGQSVVVRFSGDFIAQEDIVTALVARALKVVATDSFNDIGRLFSKEITGVADAVADQVSETAGRLATQGDFAQSFEKLKWPARNIALDPSIYRVTILDTVRFVIPILPTNELGRFLEWCGMDLSALTLSNPIEVTPAGRASFSFVDNKLTANTAGDDGALSFRAFRFEVGGAWWMQVANIEVAKTVGPARVTFSVATANASIRVSSNLDAATWTIVGPQGVRLTGSGTSRTHSSLAAGSYTITWGAVNGYNPPASETKTLAAGDSISFAGTYAAAVTGGRITVASNISSASWTISGPQSVTGSGTSGSYSNMPAGTYTISWDDVFGYTRPGSSTQTLSAGGALAFSGNYATISVSRGTIAGVVRDGIPPNAGVSGVGVSFTTSDGTSLGSTTTNSAGAYSASVQSGNVIATFALGGYVTTSLSASVPTGGTVNADTVLFAQNRSGNGTVSGRVTNAVTGANVGGVSVALRAGVGARSGTIVASTTTASTGTFSVAVPSGTYTAAFQSSGYTTGYKVVAAVGGVTIANQDIALNPDLPSGQYRIILNWGSVPADLDAHLTGPTSTGGRFHVYYPDSARSAGGATLDRDRKFAGETGPETITISALRSGTYRYSVHDYSNQSATASTVMSNQSGAVVTVFNGNTEVARFNIPSGRTGNLWTVFTLDGATGQITEVNSFSSTANEGGIQSAPTTPPVAALAHEEESDRELIAASTTVTKNTTTPAVAAAGVAPVAFTDARVTSRLNSEFGMVVTARAPNATLGAYRVVVRYPVPALEVIGVTAANGAAMPAPYAGATIQNAAGRVVVLGYQASSLTAPRDDVGLFQVRFRSTVPGEHAVSVFVEDLVTADGAMIESPVVGGVAAVETLPSFAAQPQDVRITTTTPISFQVRTGANANLAYRWQRRAIGTNDWVDLSDGAGITGTGAAELKIATPPGEWDGSQFRVMVGNSTGRVASNAATLVIDSSKLVNLSIRNLAGLGSDTLTVGFNLSGIGERDVLLRAVGPGLATFGVGGILPDPSLQLFSGSRVIASNDNWGGAQATASAQASVGAFALAVSSRDAALVQALAPGSYTAQVGGGTGVALIEIYSVGGAGGPKLTNVSARTAVAAGGDVLIAGFAITGERPKSVLVRAIGPSLAALGVAGALADPKLEIYRGAVLLHANDNWGGGATLNNAFQRVAAFPLAANSRDAAVLMSLTAGAYTVQISGATGGGGITLAEIYDLPEDVAVPVSASVSPGMVLIPGGTFSMGDPFFEDSRGLPNHTVTVSPFYLGETEVTLGEWRAVHAWALSHGYSDLFAGAGRADDNPVTVVSWYNAVKWLNAKSEMDGLTPVYYTDNAQSNVYRVGDVNISEAGVKWSANGYRLPTEAEWERAARAGVSGRRFPWGDTITHAFANYNSSAALTYDVSPTRGFHPTYSGGSPPSSPVRAFAANAYGLFGMAGNVTEWCWDWYSDSYYGGSNGARDPHGPGPTVWRVARGGSYRDLALNLRVAARQAFTPNSVGNEVGFRAARNFAP